MEPISVVVGVAAGLGSIIAVITRSIITLNDVRSKWKEADFTISLMIGQLGTVNTALGQVQAWMDEKLLTDGKHQQLLFDLNGSLSHCKLLVEHIDAHITRFDRDASANLYTNTKTRLLLKDAATTDCLNQLDHQISALTLLLTAFKCRSPSAQKIFLRDERSRVVFAQLREDASSLRALYAETPAASVRSRASRETSQSRFSTAFEFDEVLLRHKAYQKAFRSVMLKAARRAGNVSSEIAQPPLLPSSSSFELKSTAEDSARIDALIKQDAQKKQTEVKVLALGSATGLSAIIKQMRAQQSKKFEPEELESYRSQIVSLVIKALVTILDYIEMEGTQFRTQARGYALTVREFAATGLPIDRIPSTVATAILGIWKNYQVRQAYSNMNSDCATAYYLDSLDRICDHDYQPTNADIIKAPETIETMKETRLTVNETLSIAVIELDQNWSGSKKFIHQFDRVPAILYVVDLASYDQYLDETPKSNALLAQLKHFQRVCQSRWFTQTNFILLLTNVSIFKRKLAVSPLSIHVSDYSRDHDGDAALEYLLKRFRAVHQRALTLYWRLCDVDDAANLDFFKSTANSIVMLKNFELALDEI